MDPLTAVAASGLRSRMESLEMLANNVANASTGGYKSDREFYSLYVAPEAASDAPTTMPLVERPWTDFSQGVLTATGNPLDVAISGSGFFAVNSPSGALYTRNGNFSLAKDGRLVTADGYAVRAEGGGSLTLSGSGWVEIAADGTVRQDNSVAGRLEIRDFPAGSLTKRGNNYFRPADPAVQPASPGAASVVQGQLEASNAGTAESAVRLINVMRQFEMLEKAVSLGLEMNQHAIQDVAKVGS
jgi:flagellar basal-body rod protein FlgF